MIAILAVRVTRIVNKISNALSIPVKEFFVGSKLLDAHGPSIIRTVKWTEFK